MADRPKKKASKVESVEVTREDLKLARRYMKPLIERHEADPEGMGDAMRDALKRMPPGELLDPDKPWALWKVKPDLVAIVANPPESRIGDRIAYCRGQLNNLPIEALARYTKNFDTDGISRHSLIRYEAGGTSPGARELRILCDALWIPANWLLFGVLDPGADGSAAMELVSVLRRFIREENSPAGMPDVVQDLSKLKLESDIEQRQKWIDEARKPQRRN